MVTSSQHFRLRIRKRRRALEVMHSSYAAFVARISILNVLVKFVMMCSLLQMPLMTRTLQILRSRKQLSRWKISRMA